MIRSYGCLVVAAAFQVIFGQAEQSGLRPPPPSHGFKRPPIPDHCLAPPPGVDLRKCCPMPQIFTDDDLKRCRIEKEQPNTPPKGRPCLDSLCLMRNANLLLANQSVNYEKLRAFVDKWASINPNFTEAISVAKRDCAIDGGPSGPPVCEPDRVFICITSTILWNCNFQDLDGASGCRILKEHMDECRPFHYMQDEEEALLAQKQL